MPDERPDLLTQEEMWIDMVANAGFDLHDGISFTYSEQYLGYCRNGMRWKTTVFYTSDTLYLPSRLAPGVYLPNWACTCMAESAPCIPLQTRVQTPPPAATKKKLLSPPFFVFPLFPSKPISSSPKDL